MDEFEPRTSLRRVSPLPWILVAAAVLAGGAYLWFRMRAPPPPPAPVASQPAPPPAPAEPEPAPEAAAAGEAKLPDLLPGVSSNALVQRGLALDGLVRRTAIVIDNLAEGASPRRPLAFLAPKGDFRAVRRGGVLVVDPASYARYDAFAAAVTSVDASALAAVWRTARPALQTAYRALGHDAAALDRALARGLGRIAAAPVRDRAPELRDEGGIYLYADESLEMLPEVEKHLLRMGPDNTRALQAKARELIGALELPAK